MSSQVDAPLQLPSSYNFGKGTLNQNRRNTIDPNNFQLWLRHDMYASTYAKHHSPVIIQPLRNPSSPKLHTSQDMEDSYLRIALRASMPRPLPTRPKKFSQIPISMPTDRDLPLLDSTSPKMHSLTSPKWPPATSTESQSCKLLILVGW